MRFKGTLVLLVLCAGLGAFLYFYEIKGGAQREKAKQDEKVVWKIPNDDVQQVEIITPTLRIAALRSADKQWKITEPRSLEADTDEWNRLLGSACEISREDIVEENATDLAPFGLAPAATTVALKTKDGKTQEIRFGGSNPAGTFNYAALQGKNRVFLVSSSLASTFNKKLDELRNRAILKFESSETQSVELQNAKGKLNLSKEGDRWRMQGKENWAADAAAVNSLLGDLSGGRVKEFFDDNAEEYAGLGFDKPILDVRLTVGKDKAIKHLVVGLEKSKLVKKGQKPAPAAKKTEAATPTPELYLARDESRPEMFFVDKEFVDKFLKDPAELRDKSLVVYQRFDIDGITLTNAKGTVSLAKSQSGDWVVGTDKKKAKWDAVNEVFDALQNPAKGFVDAPGALSQYGLDKPDVRVILKQGPTVRADCIFGKEGKDGVYAQVAGEPYLKIADKASRDKLGKSESEFVEPPPAPPAPAPKK
jgi:hypothetical protein